MKTTMYLAATLMLFFSCSNSEKQTQESTVSSTYGTTANTNIFKRDNGEQALEVEVATNAMLDSLHPNITSAKIALMSYRDLSTEDQVALKSADIIFKKNGKLVESYTYKFETFPVLSAKLDVFNQLTQFIRDKKYKALDAARDTIAIPNGIAEGLNQKMRFLTKNYGKLKGFKTFGVAEQGDELGRAYQFQAYLEFEKRDVPYFFYLDILEGKDHWLGFSIQN